MVNGENKKITTFCRMCGEQCCIDVYLGLTGSIEKIYANPQHPWNQGIICSKGYKILDMVFSPNRITTPMKKYNNVWKEISLEDALAEIAEKALIIQGQYGARSIGIWKGEALGFGQQEEYARRFCHAIGSPNYFSCDSQCFASRYIGYSLVLGSLTVPDFINSNFIVVWGSNPLVSHPPMGQRILAAQKKGAKIIVIDPRRNTTALHADMYLQIKPGTDGALAWGIIQQIIKNQWYDREFVAQYSVGFEEIARYANQFTVDYVEKETGVCGESMIDLTREFAKSAPRSLNYVGNGLEHHENGVNHARSIACISALCGCIDRKGGELLVKRMALPDLTLYDQKPLQDLEPIGAEHYPVLYNFRKECHSMSGIDTMLTGKPYPLKALLLTGGNPALTNPNSNKVQKALKCLDLLVVRDLFMSETAQLAHYFLPAASFLERSEIVFHGALQRVGLRRKMLSIPNCQTDYEFWACLSKRLGCGDFFPWENDEHVTQWLLSNAKISYNKLQESPEGVNFADIEYEKYRTGPFSTPSGKVELTSKYLANYGYPELPVYLSPRYLKEPNAAYPFVLISGARNPAYCHSRTKYLQKVKFLAPPLEMNSLDGISLKLKNGDTVRVVSPVGNIMVKVVLVDSKYLQRGVIQITHGWHEANVNILTFDSVNDPISGFPVLKTVPVSIEKV